MGTIERPVTGVNFPDIHTIIRDTLRQTVEESRTYHIDSFEMDLIASRTAKRILRVVDGG